VEATGRGILYTVQEACRVKGINLEGATVAVQGFGNVGSNAARLLRSQGCKLVAVSDVTGGVYNTNGFEWHYLQSIKDEGAHLSAVNGDFDHVTNEELLELPVDVLIPAAMENQIHARNAPHIKPKMMIEGANGPTTPEGDAVLNENGVFVVPDILANAGGVVVSYFEWVQDLQSFFWEEDEVNLRLRRIMTRSFEEVHALAEEQRATMREAAYMLALRREAEALAIRGIFP